VIGTTDQTKKAPAKRSAGASRFSGSSTTPTLDPYRSVAEAQLNGVFTQSEIG